MAGPACKVIINNQTHALSSALETILTTPHIYRHGGGLDEEKRLRLLQRLADVDLAAYDGSEAPKGGLAGIVLELQEVGLVTPEVWQVLRNPKSEG